MYGRIVGLVPHVGVHQAVEISAMLRDPGDLPVRAGGVALDPAADHVQPARDLSFAQSRRRQPARRGVEQLRGQ